MLYRIWVFRVFPVCSRRNPWVTWEHLGKWQVFPVFLTVFHQSQRAQPQTLTQPTNGGRRACQRLVRRILPRTWDAARWERLLDDAAWVFRRHGLQLAQDGWGDLDAFGVTLRRPGGEMLLDRLDGSRRLHLDGKGRAAWGWSYSSVIMQTCAGYADLQPAAAILPIWWLVHG